MFMSQNDLQERKKSPGSAARHDVAPVSSKEVSSVTLDLGTAILAKRFSSKTLYDLGA